MAGSLQNRMTTLIFIEAKRGGRKTVEGGARLGTQNRKLIKS